MPDLRRRRAAAFFLLTGTSVAVACTTNGSTDPADVTDAAADAGRPPIDGGGRDGDPATPGLPPPPPSPCPAMRELAERCGVEPNCGKNFDAWCAANDRATNSDAYRRAEAKCLPENDCKATTRADCEYRHYNTETPTAAQRAVVDAYCRTCEPNDRAGCATRSLRYDPDAGPASVGDIYIAAWELADPLVDEIRHKCTGAAPDGGSGAGDAGADGGVDGGDAGAAAGANTAACAKAFAGCAAEVYLDAVPNCP